jgi:hypothetical protein
MRKGEGRMTDETVSTNAQSWIVRLTNKIEKMAISLEIRHERAGRKPSPFGRYLINKLQKLRKWFECINEQLITITK